MSIVYKKLVFEWVFQLLPPTQFTSTNNIFFFFIDLLFVRLISC